MQKRKHMHTRTYGGNTHAHAHTVGKNTLRSLYFIIWILNNTICSIENRSENLKA